VQVPQGWTIQVHLDPFSQDFDRRDREPLIVELSRLLPMAASHPEIWSSGLETFALGRFAMLEQAPTVAKYCAVVAGFKMGTSIHLEPGGAFSKVDPENALRTVIAKKTGNSSYATVKQAQGLDQLFLLVCYDQAVRKNTPNLDVDARIVGATVMATAPGAFDGAFIFMYPDAVNGERRQAYRIFPF